MMAVKTGVILICKIQILLACFLGVLLLSACYSSKNHESSVSDVPRIGAVNTINVGSVHATIVGEIDKSFKKVDITSDIIDVSSSNKANEGKQSLVDEDPMSWWHVKFPKVSNQHWITIDFGNDLDLSGVSIMPNIMNPKQVWDKDHAVVQGSLNKEQWINIGRLTVNDQILEEHKGKWIHYTFEYTRPHRYYRIFIDDARFLSLSGFNLYYVD